MKANKKRADAQESESKEESAERKHDAIASSQNVEKMVREQFERIIDYCIEDHTGTGIFAIEESLRKQVFALGCMFFQLILLRMHERLKYDEWLNAGKYVWRRRAIPRTIKTFFGTVRYARCYLESRDSKGGVYPLDAVLGLPSDGFSPLAVSLYTRVATRVSFNTAKLLFSAFCNWSPSTETIESHVLGLGRNGNAYMEQLTIQDNEGEVLVIEIDGKATPTATEQELKQRRGKRKKNKTQECTCQRHRGKSKRQHRKYKRKRRKKGDKSKNGRSITLVCMYTLKRDKDGRLCGPINKKVWGSYAKRKVMMQWIRRHATRRGFPPDTDKRVHLAMDGETCLYKDLRSFFPNASFVLDIQHLQEKLWDVGRKYHKEGTNELEEWVDDKREYLYTGKAENLLTVLKDLKKRLSARAKRDGPKREALKKLITYMEPRLEMMRYKEYLDEDFPIASGVIEGAVRYVIGERMDCSGMRWIPERAEALLHLRCIEINGDWNDFIQWDYARRRDNMMRGEKYQIRTTIPIDLSAPDYMQPASFVCAAG